MHAVPEVQRQEGEVTVIGCCKSMLVRRAALAVLIAGAACGGDPVDPENRPPEAVGEIEPQTIEEGMRWQANVTPFFNDPDEDTLTYKASSSDSDVASTSMAGAALTVTGVSAGTCVVTITATDPDNESATQTVDITVTMANRAPQLLVPIPDWTIGVDSTLILDVSRNFSDPDGDPLTYAAASDDNDVATAVAQGFSIRIEGIAAGTATVTVTVSDPGGLSASDDFEITVEESSPPLAMAFGTATFSWLPVYSVKIVSIERGR